MSADPTTRPTKKRARIEGRGEVSEKRQRLKASWSAFTKPYEESAPESEAIFEIELDGRTLKLSDVPGNAGVTGYRSGGVANNLDEKGLYRPYNARGMGRDFGLFHQAFLDSDAFQRAWNKIVEGLITGHWWIKPAKCADPGYQPLADLQAEYVKIVLFGLDGGWSTHIREAMYCLVGGFSPFIRVTDGFGQLRGLSFRYPSQVSRWLTNAQESELLGIKFFNTSQQSATGEYDVLADRLVIYQHNALGNNWEGISPMRAVLKYIRAHELFGQLEAAAAEKYGTPVTFVERPGTNYDEDDDALLEEALDAMVAADNPVILLPGGYKVTIASPTGQVPDFEPIKRYLDEKIASVLTAEGALVGMNGMGSYSMAEVKDDQALRTLFYYSSMICEVLNGRGRLPYTGVIDHILAFAADPDLRVPPEGLYPQLCWALSAEQDEANVEQVLAAKQAGALSWGADDETWLRERLKLPARTKPEGDAAIEDAPKQTALPAPDGVDPTITAEAQAASPEAAAAVEAGGKAADAALNGAQIASAISIIKSVKISEIDRRSGVELLKMAFLLDEDRALALLNALSVPAPGSETTPPAEVTP